MSTQAKRLCALSLFLGWIWDFLFWKHSPGISFAIYVTIFIISLFLILRSENHIFNKNVLWVLLPITAFTVLTFFRQETLSLLLSWGATILLFQVLVMVVRGENLQLFGFSDYFMSSLRLLGSMIVKPLMIKSSSPDNDREDDSKRSSRVIWEIIRGLLIAIPTVFLFASLLISADLIFAQKVASFLNLFTWKNLPEYIFRLIIILTLAYILLGIFIHAIQKSVGDKLIGIEKSSTSRFFSFTEAVIVLGSVILLFISFAVVQFQYFFGGQANIHIDGYTYSEYARRGFGELLIVGIFSLMLLYGLSMITRREYSIHRKVFSSLNTIMVGLVGIILYSAFQRLVLYENVYGFTRLRIYSHVFMIWLGIFLVITVLLEIFQHLRFFTNAALLVSLGFAFTINIINVDALIVQHNVQRQIQTGKIDVTYLAGLSTDAVPTMVELFQSSNLPENTRDALGASLSCIRHNNQKINMPLENWQSFQFSYWWAKNTLSTIENQLKDYKISYLDWKVITPEKKVFACR